MFYNSNEAFPLTTSTAYILDRKTSSGKHGESLT